MKTLQNEKFNAEFEDNDTPQRQTMKRAMALAPSGGNPQTRFYSEIESTKPDWFSRGLREIDSPLAG
jgi:hypothetical protein